MITGKQIRAARALIDWSAEDLAKESRVNRETILSLERGDRGGREETWEKVTRTFNENGIVFIGTDGVRFAPEGVDVLNGQVGLITFLNEVHSYLSRFGGTISVTGIDEKKWIDIYGKENSTKHFARMEALIKERKDVKIRSLTREGNYPITSSYTEYRWISHDRFSTVPFYLCGDMLGIIVFQAEPSPKIILIRSAVVADAYRQQFEEFWQSAKPIPTQTNHKGKKYD